MYNRRVAALVVAVAMSAANGAFAQQRNDDKKQPQRNAPQQQDIEALVKLVDGALLADPIAAAAATPAAPAPASTAGDAPAPDRTQGDLPLKWDASHFIKGQGGDTYVPFTLAIDRAALAAPGVAMYVRAVNAQQAAAFVAGTQPGQEKRGNNNRNQAQRTNFAWDNIHFADVPQDGRLSRAVQLKPGHYVVFIAVKDQTTGQKSATPAKTGLLRHEISVPDFNAPTLATSSVIVARSIEPITGTPSAADQETRPYAFGPMNINVSPDGKLSKAGELNVVFWIYGASQGDGGKPDVTVEYNFHQRLPEGEKYFNKTAPQQLNAQTLPAEFSLAAGHQLPGSLNVPLASFPPGDYRLEIKVTDKPSSKSLTQNVNFTVVP